MTTAIEITGEDTDTLRWLAEHRAIDLQDTVDLHDEVNGESPAQRLEVRANQYRIVSELLIWADGRAVDPDRVALLLGLLRLARADRERLLAEDREVAERNGADLGDVKDDELRIASIEALMERLGPEPHAAPFKGGDA
jgi:hypothetical protein